MEDLKAQRTPGTREICIKCSDGAADGRYRAQGMHRERECVLRNCPIKAAPTAPEPQGGAGQHPTVVTSWTAPATPGAETDARVAEIEKWVRYVHERDVYDETVACELMEALQGLLAILRAQSPHGRTDLLSTPALTAMLYRQTDLRVDQCEGVASEIRRHLGLKPVETTEQV